MSARSSPSAFWVEFLRSLQARGLHRRAARRSPTITRDSSTRSSGSSRARGSAAPCISSANMHQHCRRDQRGLVSAALREIFNAEDGEQARERIDQVLERLQPIAPKVCELLEDAEEDLIAFYALPARALDQAAIHEPARARQPRDRPALRRRRHLPQRHRRDPSRRRAPDRTKRRMARLPPLPLRRDP